MPYEIIITKAVGKEIKALPKHIQTNVINHIWALAEQPRPQGCRKLVGEENLWRIRVGHYRIIYHIQDEQITIEIVRVRHRKEVYE
jgi:mRNA interferase RelE/StbE